MSRPCCRGFFPLLWRCWGTLAIWCHNQPHRPSDRDRRVADGDAQAGDFRWPRLADVPDITEFLEQENDAEEGEHGAGDAVSLR